MVRDEKLTTKKVCIRGSPSKRKSATTTTTATTMIASSSLRMPSSSLPTGGGGTSTHHNNSINNNNNNSSSSASSSSSTSAAGSGVGNGNGCCGCTVIGFGCYCQPTTFMLLLSFLALILIYHDLIIQQQQQNDTTTMTMMKMTTRSKTRENLIVVNQNKDLEHQQQQEPNFDLLTTGMTTVEGNYNNNTRPHPMDFLNKQVSQQQQQQEESAYDPFQIGRNDDDEQQQQEHPIRQISILGERNSGTRWTVQHIQECFNHSSSLNVVKRLTRYKHWFQYYNTSKYPGNTLVLAQYRNPYDWLKAMEHVPHHSPAHLRTKINANVSSVNAENDWRIFLSKPWTMEDRIGYDVDLMKRHTPEELRAMKCQDDYTFYEVNSCTLEPLPHSYYNHTLRYSEHQPFYEMNTNDVDPITSIPRPYDNIMELRSDKIRNWLSIRNWINITDVWMIQYEYLLYNGTQHLLDRIEEYTGVSPQCIAKQPQYNRKPKKSRLITREYAQYIRTHLNWTMESYIGYNIELYREQINN